LPAHKQPSYWAPTGKLPKLKVLPAAALSGKNKHLIQHSYKDALYIYRPPLDTFSLFLVLISHNLLNLAREEGYTYGSAINYMGLLNIFKKSENGKDNSPGKANPPVAAVPVIQQLTDEQRISLEKTQSVADLLSVAKAERDEQWADRFLADLPLASFRCGTPQIVAGPDGFPYFQLFVPAPGEEFQSFVVERMTKEFLLERGYGVLINPGAEDPDWVLSYGDILNYSLNGAFFTHDSLFSSSGDDAIVGSADEEIMIGQPAENILPGQTRKLLKDFFELNGIEDPKVLMMVRKNGTEMCQDLAFNITPAHFESDTHYRNMMQTVTWYLPRHYSLIGLNDPEIDKGFMPL